MKINFWNFLSNSIRLIRKFQNKSSYEHQELHSDCIEFLLSEAYKNLWGGRIDGIIKAKFLFEAVLLLNPTCAQSKAGMARVMRCFGKLEIAHKFAYDVEKSEPKNYENLIIKGFILRDMGKLSVAALTLARAAGLMHKNPRQLVIRLWSIIIDLVDRKRYDEAISEIIEISTLLGPNSWEPYRLGWWVLKEKGETENSQYVASGRFMLALNKNTYFNNVIIEDISSVAKKGNVIDDRLISAHELQTIYTNDIGCTLMSVSEKKRLDPRLTILKNTTCFSSKFCTAFLTGGALIDEISINDSLLHCSVGRLSPIHIENTVLNLAFPWGEGYFHFMMEVIPTIGLAWEIHGKDSIEKYYLRMRVPYQIKMLDYLGIKEEKLIFSDETQEILPKKIIIVSNISPIPPFYEAVEWSCIYLRNSLLKLATSTSKYRRIYISRDKNVNGRRIHNENKLLSILSKYEIEKICPENLSIADQISLYKNAELIVGPAGGALVNLVFCNPSCKVLVLFPENCIWKFYESLAAIIGLKFYKQYGINVHKEIQTDPDWMEIFDNSDFIIDPHQFESELQKILSL